MTSDARLIEVQGLLAPQPRGEEAEWFAAAANLELVVTLCRDCGARSFPLRALCPTCGSRSTQLDAVSGDGVVHSFTIQHRRQHPDVPVPNVLALIDLAEGPRLLSRLERVDPTDVHIGMRVEVRFAQCGDFVAPVFIPAADP